MLVRRPRWANPRAARLRALPPPWTPAVRGVDHYRDRPIVRQRHHHVRLERPRRHPQPRFSELCDGVIKQRLCQLGPCGFDETRTASFAGVRVQGELANQEEIGANVHRRVVELPLLVCENPQVGDLVYDVVPVRLRVVPRDSNEDYQPGAYLSDDLFLYGHRRP